MIFLDITITPDFNGLPPSVVSGLMQLTNNAAGLLELISGIGIAVSLIGLVIGYWTHSHGLTERFRGGLICSTLAIAFLYLAEHAANYSAHLFAS